MRPKSKRVLFVVTALCTAGCARSDYPNMRSTRPAGRPTNDKSLRNVEDEKPPKILPETHFAAGMLLERQGQVDQALVQYRKATALNHHYLAAYHRLGLVLSAVGRHDEALSALRRAAELRPDNAAIRNNLGFEYLLTEQLDQAERELRRALQLQPTFARANINLGLVLAKTGRFDEALASFRQVLPETDAYYNLGLLFRGQRRYSDAAIAFEHTLFLDPEFNSARIQLAELNARINAAKTEADALDAHRAVAETVTPEPEPTVAPTVVQGSSTDEPPSADDIFAMIEEIVARAAVRTPPVVDVQPTVVLSEREAEPAAAQPPVLDEPVAEDRDPVIPPTEVVADVMAEPPAAMEPNSTEDAPAFAALVDDDAMMPDATIHPTTQPLPAEYLPVLEADEDEVLAIFPEDDTPAVGSIRESWMMLEELEAKVALLRYEMNMPLHEYVASPFDVNDGLPTQIVDDAPQSEAALDEFVHDETPTVHTEMEAAPEVDSQDPTASAEPMDAEPCDPASLPAEEDTDWAMAFADLEALLSVVINETRCWDQIDVDADDAFAFTPSEPCLDSIASEGVMTSEAILSPAQPEQSFEEFVEEDVQAQAKSRDDGSN